MSEELLFSRFKIIREIGKGGFGTVLQAFDLRMERNVAIKKLPKDAHTAPRAIREARTIALLSHPNIVTLHDFLESENYFYLVMEQIKGLEFDDILSKHVLDWQEAVSATLQVSHALECAHLNYVIHRDIKPGNLILLSDGRVKVLDFGIAKLLGNSPVSYKEGIVGTLSYLSPEQATDDVIDERSDIFSLGVFCYEAMTGINPFHAETQKAVLFKIQNHTPKHPSELEPDVPENVSNVVMKMLEKDPNDRFSSVIEMRYKMLRYAGDLQEQHILKKLYLASMDQRTPQEVEGRGRNVSKNSTSSLLSNLPVAALLLALIISTGPLITDGRFPLWAFMLGAPIAAISLRWPRAGVLLLLLIIAGMNMAFNIVLGVSSLVLLLGYGYLMRDRSPLAIATSFSMPLFSKVGAGLSFPLIAGLLLGPLESFIAGAIGSLVMSFSDAFISDSISFTAIRSPKMWYAPLGASSLISQVFSLFYENTLVFFQALLIGLASAGISFARSRVGRLSSLLALAVLIFVLYGYRIITLLFSANPNTDYEAASRTWSTSLVLSVPILLVWGFLNYKHYAQNRIADDGTTKRIRE